MTTQLFRHSPDPARPAHDRRPTRLRLLLPLAGAIIAPALVGCGSGGGDASSSGGLSARALWQQPDDGAAAISGAGSGGFGSELPAAVRTVRIDFAPAGGAACCVAIDPSQLSVDPDSGRRRVVLTQLVAGPGLLTIAGFPGSSAPPPAGATATCEIEPAGAAAPCLATSLDGPSFISEPTEVTVRAGTQTNAGDILVPAVPFFITDTLQPPPNGNVATPVQLAATVAISGTDLPIDSVTISTAPGGAAPVTLTACDDFTGPLCSPGGSLEVRGLRAVGQGNVASGNATVEVVANGNGTDPLRIEYAFTALGVAATATPPPPATATPPATNTGTPRTPAPGTATPTFTETPTRQFTPTSGAPTATPNAMCGSQPATGCLRPIDGRRSSLVIDVASNPRDDRLVYEWERGNFVDGRDFGDPELVTSYAICIYDDVDGASTLVRQLFVPAGASCAGGECWDIRDDGFRYLDSSGQRDGITRLDLVSGQPGSANILLRASGAELAPPQLPFDQDPTLVIQVKNDFEEGQCWETSFTAPAERNTESIFRDVGDSAVGN